MGKKNIRIPVTLNNSANITFNLEQEFESLDVLTMRITSSDVYLSATSNFGVVVGRVGINDGFGVQNARVSVFVPITAEDKLRSEIVELYPFETINDSFPNGVRYNLLPRIKQKNPDHVPAGTFPDITDLTHYPVYFEILDKYYKYTTTTNEYGDYMIFGVPIGQHNILMDFDVLDTPSLSVNVNDLIYNVPFGKDLIKTDPEKVEADRIPGFTYYGNQTYTLNQNTDLSAMPNIFSEKREITVIPFWGDKTRTTLGITRADFSVNYTYKPTATFFGNLLTTTVGKGSISPKRAPSDYTLNELTSFRDLHVVVWYLTNETDSDTGAISTIQNYYGTFSGLATKTSKTINPDLMGAFKINLPMYEDYYVMNEFGEIIESIDNTGVPTTGRYMFEFYENDEVWSGRLSNENYNRELLPGLRIPANDEGNTLMGGWDTNGYRFEYDIQNARRKYYTISTTYQPTLKTVVYGSNKYFPYLPSQVNLDSELITNSGFPLIRSYLLHAKEELKIYNESDDTTVIGSAYIPRIIMGVNGRQILTPDNIITYLTTQNTSDSKNIGRQEWLIGLRVKDGGLHEKSYEPMSNYYGIIYDENVYKDTTSTTWNYGLNSDTSTSVDLIYSKLSQSALESSQVNSEIVFNMFTTGVLKVSTTDINGNAITIAGTTGPFINSLKSNGSTGLLTTNIYDITDEVGELIKDQINTSFKKSTTGLYNEKYYYFGKTYDSSSLKSIASNYNG